MSISEFTQAIHKLLTNLNPDKIILFYNVIDKQSQYVDAARIKDRDDYNICVADNPQVRIVLTQNKDGCDKSKVRSALLNCTHHILLDNCCELIKETDYTLYIYFETVFSFISNIDTELAFNFEYDLQNYILKKNEPRTMTYVIEFCDINTDIFLDDPTTYINLIRHTKKYEDPYFYKSLFTDFIKTYITEGCYVHGNTPSKDIIFTVCNIGGIINGFNLNTRHGKYMNLSQSCRDNYNRIIENNDLIGSDSSFYKYNKFSDVYNLYRKVFI